MPSRKGLRAVIGGVVVAAIAVTVAYLLKFGWQPSNSHERWGQFGDYLGGTLGTFFGFAAFLGVVFTIWLQEEQLDHVRKQAHIEELQRHLGSCALRIDSLLNMVMDRGQSVLLDKFASGTYPPTLLRLIGGVANVKVGMLEEREADERAMVASVADIEINSPLLLQELEYMVICLRTYRQRGGAGDIVALYRLRYHHIVGWLYLGGFTKNETILAEFPVESFVEQMKRLSAERRKAATSASASGAGIQEK